MAFRELRYFFGEAFKSMFYNLLMTLASLVTVTGCLLFLGVFTVFSMNLNYIAEQVQEECKIVAYVNETFTTEQAETVEAEIRKISHVSDATLETREQAFENAKAMLGDEGKSLDGMENDGFLRASYTISVDDLQYMDGVVEQVKGVGGIAEVQEQKEITDTVFSVTNAIKTALVIAMALLALIAVFIIANTIKLTVFAREREIHIMKYVGATDWFIRWPFIIEGVMVGLLGGLVSLLICLLAYGYIDSSANTALIAIELSSFSDIASTLTFVLLVFGVMMGALGSLIAVRRHLKV